MVVLVALWTAAVRTARWSPGQSRSAGATPPLVPPQVVRCRVVRCRVVPYPRVRVAGSVCRCPPATTCQDGRPRPVRCRGRCGARAGWGRSAAALGERTRAGRQVQWCGWGPVRCCVVGSDRSGGGLAVLVRLVLATTRRDGLRRRTPDAAGTRSANRSDRSAEGLVPHAACAGSGCRAPRVHQTGRRPSGAAVPQARSSDLTSSVQLVLGDVLNHTIRYQIPHRKSCAGAFSHICG